MFQDFTCNCLCPSLEDSIITVKYGTLKKYEIPSKNID